MVWVAHLGTQSHQKGQMPHPLEWDRGGTPRYGGPRGWDRRVPVLIWAGEPESADREKGPIQPHPNLLLKARKESYMPQGHYDDGQIEERRGWRPWFSAHETLRASSLNWLVLFVLTGNVLGLVNLLLK